MSSNRVDIVSLLHDTLFFFFELCKVVDTCSERVVIPKSMQHITLKGAGRDVTKITEKNVAGQTGTTYTSSTFGVSAPYFTAFDISFEVQYPRVSILHGHFIVTDLSISNLNCFKASKL